MDVLIVNKCNQSDEFRTVLPAKMCVRVLTIMVLAAASAYNNAADVGGGSRIWNCKEIVE